MQDSFFHEEQRADLLPSARRGAIIAFRLAMQFAVLRWIEMNGLTAFAELCKQETAVIDATDEDVNCAVLLAKTFASHAHKLSSLLPQTAHAVSSPKTSVSRFLDALPEDFETREAVNIGAKLGIDQRRTVERYLKRLTESGALRKTTNGKYFKPTTSDVVATVGTAAPAITATPTIPSITRVSTNTTKPTNPTNTTNPTNPTNTTKPTNPTNTTKPTIEDFIRQMVKEQSERAARANRAQNFDFGAEQPPDYENSIYEF
jgi:hypothetical protein